MGTFCDVLPRNALNKTIFGKKGIFFQTLQGAESDYWMLISSELLLASSSVIQQVKVYLKYTWSILKVYLKYASSLLEVYIKYTLEVYFQYIWSIRKVYFTLVRVS